MSAQHSPLPWRVAPLTHGAGGGIAYVCTERCRYGIDDVAVLFTNGAETPVTHANAKFIVRCVNSHDELLAALKVAAQLMEDADMEFEPDDDEGCMALRIARAAIAKAEAE